MTVIENNSHSNRTVHIYAHSFLNTFPILRQKSMFRPSKAGLPAQLHHIFSPSHVLGTVTYEKMLSITAAGPPGIYTRVPYYAAQIKTSRSHLNRLYCKKHSNIYTQYCQSFIKYKKQISLLSIKKRLPFYQAAPNYINYLFFFAVRFCAAFSALAFASDSFHAAQNVAARNIEV